MWYVACVLVVDSHATNSFLLMRSTKIMVNFNSIRLDHITFHTYLHWFGRYHTPGLVSRAMLFSRCNRPNQGMHFSFTMAIIMLATETAKYTVCMQVRVCMRMCMHTYVCTCKYLGLHACHMGARHDNLAKSWVKKMRMITWMWAVSV